METEHQSRVREDYGNAAVEAKTLCFTDAYKNVDLRWVPAEVLERNQGCTSPFAGMEIGLRRGDVVVDLGSGAGLDAFIAARQVGRTGRVIGIDMTPEMLEVARRNVEPVTRALGYDEPNVRFEQSVIERLPLADSSVDVVLSNCVINLCEDKRVAFSEIFRVLKPGGRFVISDVFCPQEVPMYMKNDRALISACIGGAMAIPSFLSLTRACGFRGLTLSHSGSYSRIDGVDYLSLTVSGYRHERPGEGTMYATLIGPCSTVTDEDGTTYERGKQVEVSAATAVMLQRPPYRDYFFVSATPRKVDASSCKGVLPEPGPCVYVGEYATLLGPFTQVRDDDGHVFEAGLPVEICEKTSRVLHFPLYQRLFTLVNRAQQRPDALSVQCGPACC